MTVLVRTGPQLRDVVDGWPLNEVVDLTTKHVMYLGEASHMQRFGNVRHETMGAEQYWVCDAHLYLYLPYGMGRSTLGPWVTRRSAGATTRNWNTVVALREMASGLQ